MIDISLDRNIFVYDELSAAIQELDLMFNTENTELIGYTTYGTNWWTFLWNLTPLESELQKYITEKMYEMYFVPNFNPSVEVQHLDGTENSIYYVKITLYDSQGNELTIQQYEIK